MYRGLYEHWSYLAEKFMTSVSHDFNNICARNCQEDEGDTVAS